MSTEYGAIDQVNIISDMMNKTIVEIEARDNELSFIDSEGLIYTFWHNQDCCETVVIEDICGDLDDLKESPILMAEETIHQSIERSHPMSKGDRTTYTFYKFATVKGYVTVRWYGESNGCYSERVDFKISETDERINRRLDEEARRWLESEDSDESVEVSPTQKRASFSKYRERLELDKSTLYVIVAGSRTFTPEGCTVLGYINQELANAIIDRLIKSRIAEGYRIVIVEGEAPGADQTGKDYAVLNGYDCKGYPAKWDTYGRSAGFRRNDEMYRSVAFKPNKGAILFWDGESKGTRDNFYRAKKYGVPIRCFNFVEWRFMSAEEIEELQNQVEAEYREKGWT